MDKSLREPQSLSLQVGLVTLETIHKNCLSIESDYMKVWLPALSRQNLEMEEQLNCDNLNWEEVIMKYKARQRKTRKKVVRRVEGIPVGVNPKVYITYRKCMYLLTISKWRESLLFSLSPPVINELMQIVVELFRHTKDRIELGALTLQAVLMSKWSHSFLTATTSLYQSYRTHRLEPSDPSGGPSTRIGHAVLSCCLGQCDRLTHLALEKVATDSLLEVVANTANHLTFLNINNSKVTDRGLLDLCGLQEGSGRGGRMNLSRECKVGEDAGEWGRVRNLVPRWKRREGRGCFKLSHLEAIGLSMLSWNNPTTTYTEYQMVPLDAGFVAVVDSLPIKILNTEVGGRVVLAWARGKKKARQEVGYLQLEVLVEAHPTTAMMAQIAVICPALRELRVDWHQFYSPHSSSREDWLSCLPLMPDISSIVTSDIDHKTEEFITLLPTIGHNITRLHLQELWSFKYSLLREIKRSCSNLEKLVILMTCKEVVGAVAQISVEKDVDLALENSVSQTMSGMTKLKSLQVMGPVSSQLARFLMAGCVQLESLTLAVEWPDPAFCNVVPGNRKDFLGKEYLQEVMQGNSLNNIKELHLMAQYARGRKHLTKDFAMFIVKNFLTLRHLGTFRLWNMTAGERREVRSFVRTNNMNIILDLDMEPRPSENVGDFRNIFVSKRSDAACSWLPVKQVSTFSFFEEVADMFAEPALFWPAGLEDSDEDQSNDEDGDEGDGFGFEDQAQFQVGLDPLCAIQ